MADLTRDEILKLARLSRLQLNDAEIDEFIAELSEILEYVKILDGVDVIGLMPTSQVTGLVNVTRPDVVSTYGYKAEDLLSNVPEVQSGMIKVKRMIT